MSNNEQFYKDNSPDIKEFEFVTAMLDGLSNAFDDIMSQAIDNSKVSSIRAFTNIPIQIINVADACYTLSTLLTNKETLNTIGINPNLSLQEKIELWDTLPLKTRAQALEQAGLVLMLVNPNVLKEDESYDDTFKVVDFEMYDYNTGDKLIFGIDYYYEYNKIYFLKFGAQTSKYNNKSIILKNIVVDNNMPEKLLGESLDIYANSNFSPTEYRDIITSFASAALAGPVVNKINQSFNPDNALSIIDRVYGISDEENTLKGVYIVDYKSANDVMKTFWDNNDSEIDTLTEFDFLVTIPSEYLHKSEKIEYIYKFMNMIKPVHAAFIFCPEYNIKDTLSMRYLPHSFSSSGSLNILRDILKNKIDTDLKHFGKLSLFDDAYIKRHRNVLSDLPQIDTDYCIDAIVMTDEYTAATTHDFFEKYKEKRHILNYYAQKSGLFDKIIKKGELISSKGDISLYDRKYFDNYKSSIAGSPSLDSDYRIDMLAANDKLSYISNSNILEKIKCKSDKITKVNVNYSKPYDKIKSKLDILDSKIINFSLGDRTYIQTTHSLVADLPKPDTDYYVDMLVMKDDFELSLKFPEIVDKFNAIDKKPSFSLKNDNVYDNINKKAEIVTSLVSKDDFSDNIKFASAANQMRCDWLISCDLDQDNPITLDSPQSDDDDANVKGKELVSIKLIPKS